MFSNVFDPVQISFGYSSGLNDICIYFQRIQEAKYQSQNSAGILFIYFSVNTQSRCSSFVKLASLALKTNSIHSFAKNVAMFLFLVSSNFSRLFVIK